MKNNNEKGAAKLKWRLLNENVQDNVFVTKNELMQVCNITVLLHIKWYSYILMSAVHFLM